MSVTTYWSPNQAAVAQVETYTFLAPNSIGNTYSATINGKTVTYTSVSGDTAATVTAALFALLQTSTIAELQELSFANPTTTTTLTATAQVSGVPFANVPGTSLGLSLTTGNGLVNGITTSHTQANQSPSDVNDPQNWLRINTSTTPPTQTRALPQNGDNGVVARSAIPMLWNLDQLKLTQFATYQRWQSMTGQIGLPPIAPNGYTEWRAQYFQFVGPQGSVPAGGLSLLLGYPDGGANGPTLERYNVGSQQAALTILSAGQIDFLGVHTLNTFTALGGVTLNIAANPGEIAQLTSSTVDGNALVTIGAGVTWTPASTLTMLGGSAILNSAPATLAMSNAAQVVIFTDQLTWPTITAQGGCSLTLFAGGIITNLTLSQGSILDKSNDARALTLTNHTLDGDTCQIIDPLNSIVFTNAGTVKQQVTSGPYVFTGPRIVKVT